MTLTLAQGQADELAGLPRPDFIAALIRAGVSVVQNDSADEIMAEAALLAAHSGPVDRARAGRPDDGHGEARRSANSGASGPGSRREKPPP